MPSEQDQGDEGKQLRTVQINDGKINFTCLRDACPNSCCGPFGGVQRGIDSVEGRRFSDIVLTPQDTQKIIEAGSSHLIESTEEGRFRMRLQDDGTCTAFRGGICTIHKVKPTLCRAFPFYVDMFVGLCGVTACPGFGAGWTKVEDLKDEIEAAKHMYEFWLDRLELPASDPTDQKVEAETD